MDGWVKREYDINDKRVIRVSLTSKGKNGIESQIDNAINEYSWIFNSLNLDEQKELLRIIKKIHKNAHKIN